MEIKIPTVFSFKETVKEQILQFSFAPFLCTKFMKSSTIGNFPIPMFFIHFSFQALAILVGDTSPTYL